MGTFRTLSSVDVAAILRGFAVGNYEGHTAITAGTINTNASVRAGGRRYFLRVNEGKARADVEQETGIVVHAAARGVPTPVPLRARDGAPFLLWSDVYVSLFPWIDGQVLHRGVLAPEHAREAGRALGGLHLAGVDCADHRAGRYEPDEIQRRFDGIAAGPAADSVVQEAVAELAPELTRLRVERANNLPLGLIHGDLFIDNVLYAADGRLVALLDFEQASWGRLSYDVAVSLLAFGFGQDDFRPRHTRDFIEGYLEVRSPTPAERSAFGAELRFASCRFAVTRITDVYLRRADGAPGGKDFRRYLLRLRRVREHLAKNDGLLALG